MIGQYQSRAPFEGLDVLEYGIVMPQTTLGVDFTQHMILAHAEVTSSDVFKKAFFRADLFVLDAVVADLDQDRHQDNQEDSYDDHEPLAGAQAVPSDLP